MGYVQAGYSIVLAILFVYALSLLVRRRRLVRAVSRLAAPAPPPAEGPPATESLVTSGDGLSGRGGGAGPERVGAGPDPGAAR